MSEDIDQSLFLEETVKGDFWDLCLRKIYGLPASVSVVKGEWKTGKTDFSLHLVEECKRLGLVSRAASNIMCFKDRDCKIQDKETVEFIDNFVELKSWLYTGYRKMYVYDETMKSAPSRRAMSALNTGWLEIIPELSKGRCHLVVITQETDFTEKSFLHPTFIRAMWKKLTVPEGNPQFRKQVNLDSKLIPWPNQHTFKNLPATEIFFDPYRSASFRLMPDPGRMDNLSIEMKVAYEYANGLSSDDIKAKYPDQIKERNYVARMLRKALKGLLAQVQVT